LQFDELSRDFEHEFKRFSCEQSGEILKKVCGEDFLFLPVLTQPSIININTSTHSRKGFLLSLCPFPTQNPRLSNSDIMQQSTRTHKLRILSTEGKTPKNLPVDATKITTNWIVTFSRAPNVLESQKGRDTILHTNIRSINPPLWEAPSTLRVTTAKYTPATSHAPLIAKNNS
jgi:hypothetical protein